MEKQNDEYLDLMPKKEKVQEDSSEFDMNLGNSKNSNTGFELDFTDHDKGLEGVPKMDLGIGITDF
ncbi:hypothetical protein LCGC14_2797770 [marine sediment metagenome]|uniref:Uncharacterized protein n=1 Tax=marine sediment metagenome TaxID=412755 RepID=A0A0F8YNQ6_9ZZZZ